MRNGKNIGVAGFAALLLLVSPSHHTGGGLFFAIANHKEEAPAPDRAGPMFEHIYQASSLDSLPLPPFTPDLRQALMWQKKLLHIQRRSKENFRIDNLTFSKADLEATVDALQHWGSSAFIPLSEYCDAYQIAGEDGRGSVLFTGYYSPVLEVRSRPDAEFQYPIYAQPPDMPRYPTRKEIYLGKALEGMGLELAYARSLLDIQQMQLQGSGYVRFEDGNIHLFSYGGNNRHPRRSIVRYYERNFAKEGSGISMPHLEEFIKENPDKADEIIFSNLSYVFFINNPVGKKANGSGNVPLIPHLSIATDKRYIPTGSCLMASRPDPRMGRHLMSLLLAHDVGGAIKGPGHIDLYTGVGKAGQKEASLKDYGSLWLLLAKGHGHSKLSK